MNSPSGAAASITVPECGLPEVIWPAKAQLGEGLCWSPARQAVYWVDIFGKRLMRWHMGSGERREWEFGETISAVAERASGDGLIVSLQRGVAFFDPNRELLVRLHEPEPQWPQNRFNDGKCDPQGRFFTGSMDQACKAETGSLYRVDARDGSTAIDCAWAANFPVINGPAWSLDGRTIWVNDTARNVIHAGDFDPAEGTISNTRVWLRLPRGEGYPDGMTTDAQGRLWIAHWAGACVTCHAADDGRQLARIDLPATNITNVAFGGPDLRTLFITSAQADLTDDQLANEPLAGALFAVRTDAIGVAPALFAG